MSAPTVELVEDPRASIEGICGEQEVVGGRVMFCKRNAHDVPYGTGASSVKECLDELKAQGFQGNISIEYEHNWDNSVPEVTKCIDFVKQYGK